MCDFYLLFLFNGNTAVAKLFFDISGKSRVFYAHLEWKCIQREGKSSNWSLTPLKVKREYLPWGIYPFSKTRLETLSAALPLHFVVITVVFHSAERLGSFILAEEAKSQSASTLCCIVCVFVCMDSFLEDCVVCVLRITAPVFLFILSPPPPSHVHLSPKSRIIFIFSLIFVVLLSKC